MKSANEILAANLSRLMKEKGHSNLSLGKAAGIAPNTIGNYLRLGVVQPLSAKGKQKTAKLSELEMVARVLDVTLVDLLTERHGRDHVPVKVEQPVRQLLLDLDVLAPKRQSALFDAIHQEAELIREAIDQHEKKKKRTPVAAARRDAKRAVATVAVGQKDHPGQRQLPLRTVHDPFNAEPDAREAELYRRIEKTPKGAARSKVEPESGEAQQGRPSRK